MNQFERTAIFTMIENIESQLRGLKTLIATAANVNVAPGKSTKVETLNIDTEELSDTEEKELTDIIEQARRAQTTLLAKRAEEHFQREFEHVADRVSKVTPDIFDKMSGAPSNMAELDD